MRDRRLSLNNARVPGIASLMRLRAIFAVFLAVALVVAPFGMPNGHAMAAAPSNHHAQMATTGHCGEQPIEKSGKMLDKSCCTAMCIAIAAAPQPAVGPQFYSKGADRPALSTFHRGVIAELPTPPPRGA